MSATALDAQGNALSNRPISWNSSNEWVATVSSDGVVTGVAVGDATISATSEGKSGTATVEVIPVPVASVEVTPQTLQLVVGSTGSLSATALDAQGNALSNRPISWSSSNESVATVSGDGLVTGKAAGEATVTATSEGKSGTAAVAVTGYTEVGGIIRSDRAWTLEESPYRLGAEVQVAEGVTLTIEPGVKVLGTTSQGVVQTLAVWGILQVTGTAASPTEIDSLFIEGYDTSDTDHAVLAFEYARLESVRIERGGLGHYMDLSVRHSTLHGGYVFLERSHGDWIIEYNVFDGAKILFGWYSDPRTAVIRHNSFYDPSVLYTDTAAIHFVYIDETPSNLVIANNSFWTTAATAVRIFQPSGNQVWAVPLDATNNYWGTTNESVIQSMIHDRNDDLTSAAVVDYTPFLDSHHPDTPRR